MRDGPVLTSRLLLAWLLGIVVVALQPGDGRAQAMAPTAITSSGLSTAFTTPSGTPLPNGCTASCNIIGGTLAGSNLFHSFGTFSVGRTNSVNDVAKFVNDGGANITNILARITGGDVSNIFGTIDTKSSFSGANLFFLNPAGVVFGPNATLNV